MMKLRPLFYAFLLLMALPVFSQKWVEQGHKQFQELAYSDAIITLEKAVEKGYQTPRVYSEIADSYYFNANYQAAAKWYQLLFKKPKNITTVHYFRYAQSLKSIGKIEEATAVLDQIVNENSKKNKDYSVLKTSIFKNNKSKNSGRYTIKIADFNSPTSDFAPAYFGNQIVFASDRDTSCVFKRKHSWTNQSFTDLYVINPDSTSSKAERFDTKINSKFNESSPVFTKDGLVMYFTRNNFDSKKAGTNKTKTTLLKIYKAVKNGKDWNVIGALPFCNDNYNTAHPALSSDEKTLYFSSDMPGGFGESDLYQVAIDSDGNFAKPENLGKEINTFGRETFPFISQKDELYFASDAHEGFGGLDIFVANMDGELKYSKPQNVGEPVNSPMDDFGFIINFESKAGYFTSNRSNGIGMDDIYSFKELIPLPCESVLEGIVVLENAKDILSEVEVILLDANENPVTTTHPDEKGNYQFTVDCKNTYTIRINLEGYISQEISVKPALFTTTTLGNILLKKEIVPFEKGDDLAKKLALLPIYFDLGKANIRPDAVLELTKIKNLLIEFPTISIEIRSHTDSRDTFKNNENLSTRRAVATQNWLIDNGIEKSRLSAKGYGETQLLNHCSDGIPCSEEDHQLNRRSEFIVTRI